MCEMIDSDALRFTAFLGAVVLLFPVIMPLYYSKKLLYLMPKIFE